MSAASHASVRPVVARSVHPLSASGWARAATATTRREPDALDGGFVLCGTSSSRVAPAARVGHEARADGVRAPGAGAAAAAARSLALIRCASRCGISLTRTPPCVDMLHLVGDGCGFLDWGSRIGLGALLRQLTRTHHDKAPFLL